MDLEKAWIESRDEVLHSRMWTFADELEMSCFRSVRSFERERTAAMIVLEEDWEIWRTNSRPRPLLAPVRT